MSGCGLQNSSTQVQQGHLRMRHRLLHSGGTTKGVWQHELRLPPPHAGLKQPGGVRQGRTVPSSAPLASGRRSLPSPSLSTTRSSQWAARTRSRRHPLPPTTQVTKMMVSTSRPVRVGGGSLQYHGAGSLGRLGGRRRRRKGRRQVASRAGNSPCHQGAHHFIEGGRLAVPGGLAIHPRVHLGLGEDSHHRDKSRKKATSRPEG